MGIYISIITLNGLNAPTKRHRLNGYKTRPIDMLSIRNPLQTSRHKQTESDRIEKYIPLKQEAKEIWSSNSHNRQNRS